MNRPNEALAVGEACVPNIGERGRSRRSRTGVLWLAIGLGVTAWAETVGRNDWWLWPIIGAAFFLAMLGVFQAREKT